MVKNSNAEHACHHNPRKCSMKSEGWLACAGHHLAKRHRLFRKLVHRRYTWWSAATKRLDLNVVWRFVYLGDPLSYTGGFRRDAHRVSHTRLVHGSELVVVRLNSTRIPFHRSQSGAASAERPIPHKIGRKFGSASSPDLIGRKTEPNRRSCPSIGRMPVANVASRTCQNFRKLVAAYSMYMKRCKNVLDFVLGVNIPCAPLVEFLT
ncbi:hypothetical protein CSKR_111494 [Clonorchis sinensis]|uniref:Uncharacterized protein n=1 Tax=Clonorchis sinensis TaxID=79923 RepID=A0A3R7FHU4_CLOSI|nr:hypothetical protein CSKR_111494 [Clonorchis sinensis]